MPLSLRPLRSWVARRGFGASVLSLMERGIRPPRRSPGPLSKASVLQGLGIASFPPWGNSFLPRRPSETQRARSVNRAADIRPTGVCQTSAARHVALRRGVHFQVYGQGMHSSIPAGGRRGSWRGPLCSDAGEFRQSLLGSLRPSKLGSLRPSSCSPWEPKLGPGAIHLEWGSGLPLEGSGAPAPEAPGQTIQALGARSAAQRPPGQGHLIPPPPSTPTPPSGGKPGPAKPRARAPTRPAAARRSRWRRCRCRRGRRPRRCRRCRRGPRGCRRRTPRGRRRR